MKRRRILAALLALVMVLSTTTAIFAKDWSGSGTFEDVGKNDWFHGYVENLADQKIVKGYGNTGEYRPVNTLSREEAAKMIAEAAGLTASPGFKSSFIDLDDVADWALPYVYALEEAGVIKGFGDTKEFRPKEQIQRGHIAKMLVKAFGLEEGPLPVNLTDLDLVEKDPEVLEAIRILASNGIVSGFGISNEFRPLDDIDRAAFAKVIAIAQATAAVLEAEKDDATPEAIERAKKLVGNLPDDQDKETKESLEERLDELEEEEEPGPGPVTPQVSAISVNGDLGVDGVLTATSGQTGLTATYKWLKADAEDGTYEPITDATEKTYTLVDADKGNWIKVEVTGTGNYRGTVTSAAVGPVLDGLSTATITLEGETGHTNVGYGNVYLALSDDLKVTGTLKYHKTDPTGMNFKTYDKHFMVFTIENLESGADVTIKGKADGQASEKTYTLSGTSEVFVWGVETGETIEITVNYGEDYVPMVYTLDLSELTLQTKEEADTLAAVNDYFTSEKYKYAEAPGALEDHLATLGMDVSADSAYKALDEREDGGTERLTAVMFDLMHNKPEGGYDQATLTTYFNEIVATRSLTQESMNMVLAAKEAESIENLKNLEFVNILLNRFKDETLSYTKHSNRPFSDKVAELQPIVDTYNALTPAQQDAALTELLDKVVNRSQDVIDEFAEILDAIVDANETALTGVNTYLTSEKYKYAEAPGALEDHLATLGMDVSADSDYAALDEREDGGTERLTAVMYDLMHNKPADGYDQETLTTYFNEIVATRSLTQESMNMVLAAKEAESIENLKNLEFVNILLNRFKDETLSYTKHSNRPFSDKVAELQPIVDTYNALTPAQQDAALTELLDKVVNRSQDVIDEFAEILDAIVDANETALTGVNTYLTSEKYKYAEAPGALEDHLATLGMDVSADSDYAALDEREDGGTERLTAVMYDLMHNKPADGYDQETLTTYFNEIVATRSLTQESMNMVLAAKEAESIENLKNLEFVNILLNRFKDETLSYTKHSNKPFSDKVAELQPIVDTYNALTPAQQDAALTELLDKVVNRSQDTIDEFAAILDAVEPAGE